MNGSVEPPRTGGVATGVAVLAPSLVALAALGRDANITRAAESARRAVRMEQFAAAGRGELQTVVHDVLPLEHAVLAHQKMDAGEVFGRIVLTL